MVKSFGVSDFPVSNVMNHVSLVVDLGKPDGVPVNYKISLVDTTPDMSLIGFAIDTIRFTTGSHDPPAGRRPRSRASHDPSEQRLSRASGRRFAPLWVAPSRSPAHGRTKPCARTGRPLCGTVSSSTISAAAIVIAAQSSEAEIITAETTLH